MPALNRITTSTRPSPPSAARLLALALAPFSPAPRLLRARAFHGDPQGPTSGFHPGPPTSSTWRIAGTQSGPSAPLLVARAVNSAAAAAAAAATVAATAALGRRRTPARPLPSFSLPLLPPSSRRRPGLCGGVASASSSRPPPLSRAIHRAAGHHRPSTRPRKEGHLAGTSSRDRSSAGGGCGGAFVPLANQKAQQPLRASSSCASSTPFWTAGPTRSPARPAPAASTSESLESSQSLGPDEQRPPAPAFASGGVRGQQQEQQQQPQEEEHYPKATMEEGEPARPAASAPSVGDDAVASGTTTTTAGGHERHLAGDGAGAQQEGTESSKTPLPLPAPGEGDGSSGSTTTTTIEVNGKAVVLDQLGPMVVGRDGTISRIANWGEMAQIERQNTLRILGKRNQLRLGALRAAAEASEKQD